MSVARCTFHTLHSPLHTSHFTFHISHILLHTSFSTTSYLTSHITHFTPHTSHSTLHSSHLPLTPPLFHLASLTSHLTVSHRTPQASRLTPHTSHLTPQTSQFTLHCTHRIFHWKMPSLIAESCVPVIAGLHLAILSIFILVASVRYWKAQSINTQIPIFRVVHHVCTASSYYCRATHMLSHTYQFELTPRLILRSPPKSLNYLHATRFLRFQSL